MRGTSFCFQRGFGISSFPLHLIDGDQPPRFKGENETRCIRLFPPPRPSLPPRASEPAILFSSRTAHRTRLKGEPHGPVRSNTGRSLPPLRPLFPRRRRRSLVQGLAAGGGRAARPGRRPGTRRDRGTRPQRRRAERGEALLRRLERDAPAHRELLVERRAALLPDGDLRDPRRLSRRRPRACARPEPSGRPSRNFARIPRLSPRKRQERPRPPLPLRTHPQLVATLEEA